MAMTKILFVCLGNICRSAAAEAVLKKYVKENRLENRFYIDSAGTASYHEGEAADPRMVSIAARRGYEVDSISRPISKADLENFDLILTMDQSNYRNVIQLCHDIRQKAKVKPFIDFVSEKTREHYHIDSVPDPYYGGENGFHRVIDILEDAMPQIVSYCN